MKSAKYISILAGALICTGAFAETVEGPEVQWDLSVWGKQRGMTAGIEHVAEQLSARTNGRFTLKIHYGEALSKSRENLDGIQLGAFESAFFCNFYHPGKNPAWMVLTLPFLPLDSPEVALKVRSEMLEHPAFVADMARWNAMPYITASLPIYQLMGRGDAPLTLQDWSGMRVRAGGGIGQAMKELGAVPTTVPAPEIYTSVERGTLDAVSLPLTYAFAAYQVPEVSSWYTTNLSPGTTECAVVFNKDAYADLPDQYKTLLQDLRAPAYEAQLEAYASADEKNLPEFNATLTAVTYTDEQLSEFRSIAGEPIWEAWVAENEGKFDAQQVLDDLLAAAERAKN